VQGLPRQSHDSGPVPGSIPVDPSKNQRDRSFDVRNSVRALFAGITATGLLVMGASSAFAAEDTESDDDSTVTAASEGGNGGYGGSGGFGLNICPAIGILAKAEANCSAGNGGSANGGDAEADAEDDSQDDE
jgi:hypothetical protein